MSWGQLIGGVVSGIGTYMAAEEAVEGAERAQDQQQANIQQGFGWIDEQLAQLYSQYAQAESLYRDRVALAQGAGVAEQLLLSEQGDAATRALLDREQTQIGTMNSQLQSRGLGSTTVGSALARGIRSDTNRDLTQLSENVARQRAGALRYHTASEGNAMSDLASLFTARSAASQQTMAMRQQLLGDSPVTFHPEAYQMQANAWGQLGGAIAAADWDDDSDGDS